MFDKTILRGLLKGLLTAALAASAVAVQVAWAQTDSGYPALLASFSAAGLPAPGTGVVVEQVEAPVQIIGNTYYYMPDATQSIFSGVTITDEIGGGAVSWHANIVASVFYGTEGYASGISQVDVYEANYWLNNILGVDSPTAPASPPANSPAVANFSWIGSFGNPADDNDVLNRFDYMINRDNLVAVVAVNNNAGTAIPALLASSYNSIAVGLSNGQSSTGPVPPGDVDGAGRCKPDIVAPQGATSYATPEVSAAAAMLVQVARANPALSSGTNATVVKAILMAGADKNPLPSWSQTPTQPLDLQYGAGQVNFSWAYQIMTAGQQPASTTSLVGSTGWNYSALSPSGSAGSTETYYFQVPSGQPFDLSALLTWERNVAYTPGIGDNSATFTPSLATIDLNLYQASGNFTLGSLLQSSSSSIDNVQYVFDRGLTAGEYALQVTRVDAIPGAWNYALAWQLQTLPHWAAGSGSWNSAANWTTGAAPNGVNYEAVLDAPSTTGLSVTLDAPQTIGQLTLANTASNLAGYTLSAGSAGTLTFNNGGNSAQLTVTSGSHAISAPVTLAGNLTATLAAGAALEISGNINETGGSQSLTMNGQGTLLLSGSNTYSGATAVSAGTLELGNGVNDASLTTSGINVTANGSLVFCVSSSQTASYSIGGGGSLTQLGNGTLSLSGSNTYSGGTTITGGTLEILNAGALADGALIIGAGGTVDFDPSLADSLSMQESLATSGASGGGAIASSSGAGISTAGSQPALNAVPEPDTLLVLLAAGGGGLLWRIRRMGPGPKRKPSP